jgi:hypothetical protein
VTEGQSTGRNETVQMGMVLEILTSGVEDGEDTDACSEMTWIGNDLEQSLGSGAKQQRVKEPLITQTNARHFVHASVMPCFISQLWSLTALPGKMWFA